MGTTASDSGERKATGRYDWLANNVFSIITLVTALGAAAISYGAQNERARLVEERVKKIEDNGVPIVRSQIDQVKWQVSQHEAEIAAVRDENKGRDRDINEMKSDIKLILRLLQEQAKRP